MDGNAETAKELIGLIYDCVVEPDRWTRMLEAC